MKRLPAGRSVWRFGWAMSEHGAFRAASAMAFDAFLSILPLLAVAGWALQRVESSSDLLPSLLRAIPGPAGQLADADLLRLSDRAVMTLAPFSLLGFVWMSSAGVATAMAVCETMFAAVRRAWLKRRLIALAWVAGAVVTILISTTITLAMTRALGPIAGRIVAVVLLLPLVLGLVFGFFKTAIRRIGVERRVLPGALLTTGLWVVFSVLFSIYAERLARYSLVYGSMASVAMALIWFWLLSLALLAGGEVNAQLEGVREYPPSTVVGTSDR